MLLQLKNIYQQIPFLVRRLLKRITLLIAIWMLLYHLVLQPFSIPDRWLTNVTAAATAKLVATWYHQSATLVERKEGTGIFMQDKRVMLISYSCDALELYLLYAGFLLCIPTTKKRLAYFIVGGITIIFMLNVLRCFALTILSFNNSGWFNFAHHYGFTLLVDIFIFYGWVLYTKNYFNLNATR